MFGSFTCARVTEAAYGGNLDAAGFPEGMALPSVGEAFQAAASTDLKVLPVLSVPWQAAEGLIDSCAALVGRSDSTVSPLARLLSLSIPLLDFVRFSMSKTADGDSSSGFENFPDPIESFISQKPAGLFVPRVSLALVTAFWFNSSDKASGHGPGSMFKNFSALFSGRGVMKPCHLFQKLGIDKGLDAGGAKNMRGHLPFDEKAAGLESRWLQQAFTRKLSFARHGLLRGFIHICLAACMQKTAERLMASSRGLTLPSPAERALAVQAAETLLVDSGGSLAQLEMNPMFGLMIDRLFSAPSAFRGLLAVMEGM